MSQLSTVTPSRHPWKHTAPQRGDRDRDQRTQIVRVRAERDRATNALKEALTRLHQIESQQQGVAVLPKVDLVLLALQLFGEARLGCRAVSRVLSLLALALGIKHAPCPQTLINWVRRLAIVRIDAARLLRGVPLSPAPFRHGLIWLIDRSIGLGTGNIVAVLAVDAHHHHRTPSALSLDRVHCIGVSVADAWTGDTIAALLGRLIAVMGRPAASRKDGGGDLHNAVALLDEQGLASPCLSDIAHAVAGMLKRAYHDPPTFATFVSACGRVAGTLTQTLLACLAPPNVRTTARFLHGHRFFTWADRVLKLSPAGGAKRGSTLATLRACLDHLPACKALLTRFRTDASGLLACQKMLKTTGLSHDTLAQCKPRIDAMPSAAVRLEFHASLAFHLETATTLGLDHVGLPISSDPIASLFGVATHHGVGETKDAARIALRLPAFCGLPTREEAEQVLAVGVARQPSFTDQCISLTTQRREVLGNPECLASLSITQGTPHVELLPRPKNRSNTQEIVWISNSYEELSGPQCRSPARRRLLGNAAPLGRRKTALTS